MKSLASSSRQHPTRRGLEVLRTYISTCSVAAAAHLLGMSRPDSADGGIRWWMPRAVLPEPRDSTRISSGAMNAVRETGPPGAAATATRAVVSEMIATAPTGLDEQHGTGWPVEDGRPRADDAED